MSTQAAVLEPPSSKSVKDAGGCDITKPAPVDRSFENLLEAMRREWHAVARYMLTLSKDGDWNDRTVIGEWLTYAEANRLRDKLDAELLVTNGGFRRWAQASYGIALHTPAISKGNKASVGDLLLHEQVIPHGVFSLSGSYVVRQFLIAADVTAVDAGGRIVAYRDRNGEHIQTPRKPHVVSLSVIDVQGVLAHITADEVVRGHWGGEFAGTTTIEATLVRYQRIQEPVYPVGEGH